MRWKYLFSFYTKEILKSRLYIVASVMFFILLIVRISLLSTNSFGVEEYGQWAGEVAPIVQMVSLFYIIFFYRLFSNELQHGVQSFFVDGHRIMMEKISSMFLVHAIIQVAMTIITYSIFSGVYLIAGIEPSTLFLSLLRFLIVYMLSPLIFTMLYGVIVAMVFGKKMIGFFVILLVWIATGSMNSELFISFFSTIHANDWFALLFIGMNTVQSVYKSYIGFDVHWGNELKLTTWLLITSGIILTLSLKWALSKRERNLVIKLLLMISVISLLTAYGVVEVSTKAFSRADYLTEEKNYKKMKPVEPDLRYEIESYNIVFDKNSLTVEMAFQEMNTLKPTFQLYHAYPLKWIMAGDELVEFERGGDIVKVILPTNADTLTFHYEIVDTYYVPYTNGRIALLADKAWYPKKREEHMYQMLEMIEGLKFLEVSEFVFPNESYLFTIESPQVLFCNLPRRGDVYSGESQGVTILQGQGNQLTHGDYKITYPADWPEMSERVPMVLSQLETTFEEVGMLTSISIHSFPTSIVFSNYGLTTLITKDHLIYNTNYGEAINTKGVMKDFQEKILLHTVQKKGTSTMYREWVRLASLYIREKHDWEIEFYGRTYDIPFNEDKIVDAINERFFLLNHDDKQKFLQDWYSMMEEHITWDQVLELVEEW